MDLIEFDTWWTDFLVEPRIKGAKDGGYAAVDELTKFIARLAPGPRAAFLASMVEVAIAQSEGSGLALGALEKNYDAHVLGQLAKYATDIKSSSDLNDQATASACMRVLAHSADEAHRSLLRNYLLVDRRGPYWTSVPWSVWPADPDLFGRSWTRYFSEVPDTQWRNTVIVQAFLRDADALRCVREALRRVSPTGWNRLRNAVLEHLDSRWLTDEDRQRVREGCG